MRLTLLLSLVLIAALLGLISAAVGLIQSRKLFTTAPKDIQAAAQDHPERFPGARVLGWKLAAICIALMVGAFVYGGYDGIRHGFSFWQHFGRFLLMLYLWKAFDIVCLDWLLMTKTRFFQYFYPETAGCAGYHHFGFNRKGQTIRILVFPFVAALMAGVAVWIGG